MASTMLASRMSYPRVHSLFTLLTALLIGFGAARADADVLDGVLEVRSAYVNTDQGVFQLFARIAYPVNDDIRAALNLYAHADGLLIALVCLVAIIIAPI